MEAEARVTECHHELVRISALTQRIVNDPDKLIVSFTYYAHARTYFDNIISTVAMAQGETFSVYYNALNPSQKLGRHPSPQKEAHCRISPFWASSSSRFSFSPWRAGEAGFLETAHSSVTPTTCDEAQVIKLATTLDRDLIIGKSSDRELR